MLIQGSKGQIKGEGHTWLFFGLHFLQQHREQAEGNKCLQHSTKINVHETLLANRIMAYQVFLKL